LPGLRSSPTLTYVSFTPAFHYSDGTAFGGFFRDGRSPSLANQATQPFVTSFEMANPDAQAVLTKLVTRPYKNQFAAIFGAEALRDANTALTDIGLAIAAYETEAPEFHLFNSKFDAFQNGHATLTAAETAGFALFLNPTKGNCAACHIPTPVNGVPALFTDFSFDNVGIPRNWAIEANSATSTLPYAPSDGVALGTPNYRYYDMGICGPLRTDVGVTSLCGMFKVPSLRNSALRQHYFHNGVFGNLNDVVTWYATRDTDPKRWYVQADGVTPDIPYNDLPQLYDANINVVEVPYNPALAPTLNATEINELVTFLCTLTDGYDPASPASYPYPAQCQAAANAALSQ
jgi:cytochrome c peroxidase